MTDQTNPAPGWYPDPTDPASRRYWDGAAWTDDRAPLDLSGAATDLSLPHDAPGGHGRHGGPGAYGGHGDPGGYAGHGGPGGPAPTTGYGAPGPGGQPPVEVATWLWQSIVVTLLCCMPLGIPAIVFSSQAQSALNVGNIALAQDRAEQAKKWAVVSFGLGLIPFLIFVSVMLIPAVLVPFFTLSPLY